MTELLADVMPFEYQIVESASGRFRVEGVFQRSDVENANKRVYPRGIWEKELKETRVQQALSERAMFGELDHPSDGKTSLKRVSHIVTDLGLQEDGVVTGAAEILPTPNGQILQALFESGAQVGISSRGSGSVSNGVVQEDFKLGTFDFVARPSTPGALPRPSGESSRRNRTEADDAVDALVVVDDDGNDTGDTQDVDMDLFDKFCDTLEKMEASDLDEEFSTGDLNALAHDVIELHSTVTATRDHSPELVEEAGGVIIQLAGALAQLSADQPQHGTLIAELMEKIEESRRALICQSLTEEFAKEEKPMDSRLQFIKERLQEAAAYAPSEEMSPEAETEELRAQLEEMDDDELIATAIEAGVIDPADLEEDDDSDEDVTVQDLLDYAAELEGNLEEAADLVEQLAGALEEADNVDDITLKYEASLGIIQETVARFQMLQEAVGGEEKADEIVENHLNALEKQAGITEGEEASKGGLTEDDSASVVETLLNKDHTDDPAMARYATLVEGALDLLGPTAN